MDEILIEERKYVSSKRAAKLTGYAKDYVGQLCREGRVPARLVGRSWYVLESAIQDHRFGTAPAAESPRYEPVVAEELPPVQSRKSTEHIAMSDVGARTPEDAWHDWFEVVSQAAKESHAIAEKPQEASTPEVREIIEEIVEEIREEQEVEVRVPIRAYKPFEEVQPLEAAAPKHAQPPRGSRGLYVGIKFVGALITIVAVTFSVVNTGIFDTYLISSKQVAQVFGILIYDK